MIHPKHCLHGTPWGKECASCNRVWFDHVCFGGAFKDLEKVLESPLITQDQIAAIRARVKKESAK